MDIIETFFIKVEEEYYDDYYSKLCKCYLLSDKFSVIQEILDDKGAKSYYLTDIMKIEKHIKNLVETCNKNRGK